MKGQWLLRSIGVLVVVAVAAAACSDEATDGGDGPSIPPQVDQLELAIVDVEDRPWFVAVADTQEARATGLMGVTDLEDLDGMLFVFEDDTVGGFWMKDTLIPLDIAFFTAEGTLVSVAQMTPCKSDACPNYFADAPYRYALEARAGDLVGLPPDATLDPDR